MTTKSLAAAAARFAASPVSLQQKPGVMHAERKGNSARDSSIPNADLFGSEAANNYYTPAKQLQIT